jgi:hypothetical protein
MIYIRAGAKIEANSILLSCLKFSMQQNSDQNVTRIYVTKNM